MNRRGSAERRSAPRVSARLPIQVAAMETEDLVVTESMNLSRGGVSCRTAEFFAPLSRVALTLILPPFGALSKSARRMHAEGVIVRCDRVPDEEQLGDEHGFDLACCFTSLDAESKNLLEAYVAWKVLRSAHAEEEKIAAGNRRHPVSGRPEVRGTPRPGPPGPRKGGSRRGGRKKDTPPRGTGPRGKGGSRPRGGSRRPS